MFNLMVKAPKKCVLDPKQRMAGTGLILDDLAKQDTRISFQQVRLLIDNALTISSGPGLGLTVANHVNITGWGMFGYAAASCATMEEALGIVAAELNLSKSTLRRSLQAQKTTYQAVLDDMAYLVGFSDVSNFLRTFKNSPLSFHK